MNSLLIKAMLAKTKMCNSIKEKTHEFFEEERGGAEIIAVIILVAIVVLLAVFFREKIGSLVSDIWNGITGKTPTLTSDF